MCDFIEQRVKMQQGAALPHVCICACAKGLAFTRNNL